MKSRFAAAALVAISVALACGCTRSAEVPAHDQPAPEPVPAQYENETVTVVLPKGDTGAGRQAFLDLKCAVCHRVVGETTLPAPVSGTQGPDLDHTLGRRPASDVAAAIIVPSHSMSLKTSDDVKARLDGTLSPMPDVSRTVTVRQLADLLVYLRSLETSN